MNTLQIVHSLARLQCTKCGAEANASCNCGQPYVPVALRVKEYDEANPGKSSRKAAADLGVSHEAVSKVRQWAGMYRVRFRDGHLTDIANISRARDAAVALALSDINAARDASLDRRVA